MDEFRKKFIEEATDLINALEGAVLVLEEDANNPELINEVFRIMHSLKGGGAMFGFTMISEFTHNLENIYDEIRSGKKKINKELLDITFISVDHLRNLIKSDAETNPAILSRQKELITKISVYIGEKQLETINTPEQQKTKSNYATYYILFKPHSDIFDNGTNPLFLIDDVFELGDVKVYPRIQDIPVLGIFDYAKCYVYWEFILQTQEDESEISDIFMFVEDDCELEVEKISDGELINNERFMELVEKLDNDSRFDKEELKTLAKDLQSNSGESNDKTIAEKITKFSKESEITSIRIATEKIDTYMNLVSELVTALAGLKLLSKSLNDENLMQITESLESITEQIRDNALSITLIPVENTVIRFRRLVRDLSSEFNKNIEFTTHGTDTTIDKTLLQIITDPLMHIIRNSIDHGIETAEERIKSGKPTKGTITLKAFHAGSSVHIIVEDDGRGLNIDKIQAKAKEKGLIPQDLVLSKEEAVKMIFQPGFSTADKVTDVSGRGVGMDVLKRKMFDIRGDISVETELNKGTKITLKVPLTLSIVDGLLVTLGDKLFILPLTSIARIKDIEYQYLKDTKRNIVTIDDKQVPFYFLREELGIEGEYPEELKFIMIKYENSRVGLVFDKIVGEYQAVLKPLGKLYRKHEIISGASILGDGSVALVLDTNKLIQRFANEISITNN